jgi:DNA-binding GntR family transcriptional regulator
VQDGVQHPLTPLELSARELAHALDQFVPVRFTPREERKDQRPRRGAIVADIGPARLCEMFELMAELEAMCGRLAARRIDTSEQEALLAAHRACEAARNAQDPDAYYRLNEVFHHRIYAASHNGFLAEQATALHRRLRPYRRLQLRVRDRMNTSYSEHQAVVDAILAGNAELAAERLRGHVTVQGERFADLIASLSLLKSGGND